MSKINQIAGDFLKKVNPELANCIVISRRIKREANGKKVIILSSDNLAKAVDLQLEKDGINCAYFADLTASDQKINQKEVKALESIMYENSDEIYLCILASNSTHRILGKLIEWGYTDKQYHIFCNENIPGGSKLLDVYDVTLGYTRKDDMLGFTIFDNGIDKPDYNIVTLGGSTTDATFAGVMSWSEFLQHKLLEQGLKVRIWCGGIAAANSTQELLKLIRDVIPMTPDAVLVYSGINDIKMNVSDTPFVLDYQLELAKRSADAGMIVNQKAFRNVGNDSRLVINEVGAGLPNKKPYSSYWVDNVRMMHAICKEFDIPFKAFLQPNAYISKGGEVSFHKELFTDSNAKIYENTTKEMQELSSKYDYIVDLTAILDNQKKWYMDDCHVLEPANAIIADAILPYAKKLITEK